MIAYYYTPQDIGMENFPAGEMRPSLPTTNKPDEADVFILPAILRNFTKEQIYALPHMRGNESRHVFWNCAEDVKVWYELPSLFFRCDATQEIKQHDPNTFGWPWPVENMYRAHEPFQYDTVFQGWNSTPLTAVVCNSVKQSKLTTHIQLNDFFYGYKFYEPEYQHYKASFKDTLSQSRLSLVPRSIPGVVRYRFYEALSMGRVPIHLCDDRLLPWTNKIDYDKCSIHIPENMAEHTGDILTGWLSWHDDSQIVEMGNYGRWAWETWLDSTKWNDLFTIAITEHFSK